MLGLFAASCTAQEVDAELTMERSGSPVLDSVVVADLCGSLRAENQVFGDAKTLTMQIGAGSPSVSDEPSECSVGLGADSITGRAEIKLSPVASAQLEALLADFSDSRTVEIFEELCGGFIVAGTGRAEEGGWTSAVGALKARDGSLLVAQADASADGSPLTLTRYVRELLRMATSSAPAPDASETDFC